MKILILLVLVISSHASADDGEIYKVCSLAKMNISMTQSVIKLNLETINNYPPDSLERKFAEKQYKISKQEQLDSAKLYDYLDCKEVIKEWQEKLK
jgi:hypothetical protein